MAGCLRILSLLLFNQVFDTSANTFTSCLMIIHEVPYPENFQVVIACMFSEFVISECPSVTIEYIQ